MGSVSADMKFMEASSKVWFTAGLEGQARRRLHRLGRLLGRQALDVAAVHDLRRTAFDVVGVIMPGFNTSKGSIEDLNRVGSYSGDGADQSGSGAEGIAPVTSDRRGRLVHHRHPGEAIRRVVGGFLRQRFARHRASGDPIDRCSRCRLFEKASLHAA